jgi:hypothetical protein
MTYKTIMMCALLAGTMQHAWGMVHADKERDKLLVLGKFWGISEKELPTLSNDEIERRIDSQKKVRCAITPGLEGLEQVHLVNQGFRPGGDKGD